MSGGSVLEGQRFTVRSATEADIEAMRAIEADTSGRFRAIGLDIVADDPPHEPQVLLDYVRAGLAWVAGEGSDPGDDAPAPVGYALASVVDGEGHLDQVSVLERATGRGIGSALVDVVLAWSAAAGHPAVTLTTYRDVPWNGPWYARRGFVEIPDEQLTPDLRAILEQERAMGFEPPARIAMRRLSGFEDEGDRLAAGKSSSWRGDGRSPQHDGREWPGDVRDPRGDEGAVKK